jgi:subtilisin
MCSSPERNAAPRRVAGGWCEPAVTATDLSRPAWSEAFATGALPDLRRIRPFGTMDRQSAFGDAAGRGVTVAIIDSGVEADHPAVGGRLVRSLRVESSPDGHGVVDDTEPGDLVGHGTACAGIIHAIAPAAELVSIRVLGADNRGAGTAFAAALEWAISQRFAVVNLSLSSRSEAMAERFHELADHAYFSNTLLVAAANNAIGPSYPSLFAAVVSVAAHDIADPDVWMYNPSPPVEFGGHGLDVDVAWRGGTRIRATGNSFAAPHLAGRAALIRAQHPDASPFEVKAILAATADDPRT